MNTIEIIILGALIGVLWVWLMDVADRRRRRTARRAGDAAFMATVATVMQKKRRIRPKADPRIQRRRFGS